MTTTENKTVVTPRTTTRRRRALAVVTAGAVAALVPMGAAQADTRSHTDPAADMFDFGDSVDSGAPLAAPEQVDGDITTWSVTHSSGSVTVRAAFTDLSRTGDGVGVSGTIRTDAGRHPQFVLFAEPGRWKGELSLVRSNGTHVRCTTSHTIDYAANTVVIKMARACFDRPTWVRAQLSGFNSPNDADFYLDDGLSSGHDFRKSTGRAYRG